MAILIPVALEGLHLASRAGEVAARKSEAVLVAESVLNENVIGHQLYPVHPKRHHASGPARFSLDASQ